MALISLIIATVALLVALGGLAYTRRQTLAGERVTAIESSRRQEDLTPGLSFAARENGDRQADLTIELTGPAGLDRLDEVTVRIRDDRPDRGVPGPGSQLTADQLSEVIWGPYRFNMGQAGVNGKGRVFGPFPLLRNEPLPVALEQSIAPSWYDDPGRWRRQYEGTPVRLEITCQRAGHEPWVLLREVDPDPDPASQVM